ncbi:protein DOWN-REGULATED IN DIF1 11-like [Vigna umbellata]|uniref:Prolamin-like domain-containing protein n=2 Tax=Phaseolus angularis TaxID=3914 RepID=A0A0L9V0A5_PHAAN|nr:protein DOWN-REGULATED IN DIF1 11 [Vigna angularis]XP_047177931.1 protein DOWN-REGULATED IN DIF1 11-like [Vigna umbellata]KOM48525.1 hypothetical protein LR48_Vigan07g222900 [Vigna angularis]
MATFSNNFCLMLLCFMMSSTLMLNTVLSNVASAPSNWPGPVSSSYESYLANCASHLDPICGRDIYFAVFYGNATIIKDCCDELVRDVGKVCHDDMTKFVLTKTQFKSSGVQIVERSQKVWNDCVGVVES